MRTEWEANHILGFSDLKFASEFFNVKDVRFWHIIGYLGAHLKTLAPLLDRLDRALEQIPLVQRMAWIFTFELHSRK